MANTSRITDINFEEMDEVIVGEDELLFRNADRYYYEPNKKDFLHHKKFSIKSQIFFLIASLLFMAGFITLLILGNNVEEMLPIVLKYRLSFILGLIATGLFSLVIIFKIIYCALEPEKKLAKSLFNIQNSTLDFENKNGKKAIIITKSYSYLYYLIKAILFLCVILVAGAIVFAFVVMMIDSDNLEIGHLFIDIFGGAILLTIMVLGANKDWYFHYYSAYILSFNGLSYMFKDKKFTKID